MAYKLSSCEKCKVFFKEDDFLGQRTHENYGVEVGTIDNFKPPINYMDKKNDINNFSFYSVCDDNSKYNEFRPMNRKHVEINIVSDDSGKHWRMKGIMSVYFNINIGVKLSMKDKEGKIIINDIINFYLKI